MLFSIFKNQKVLQCQRAPFLCLIVVNEVEGAVEGAEGQVGGPVELHLLGQVAGAAAAAAGTAHPHQVVLGSRTPHKGPNRRRKTTYVEGLINEGKNTGVGVS